MPPKSWWNQIGIIVWTGQESQQVMPTTQVGWGYPKICWDEQNNPLQDRHTAGDCLFDNTSLMMMMT